MTKPPRRASSPAKGAASESQPTENVVPADIRELLGPAAITSQEDSQAYQRVLAQMALAILPQDFVEWTWVKDIVDLGWEAARARRAKAVLITLARRKAIENVLRAYHPQYTEAYPDLERETKEEIERIQAEFMGVEKFKGSISYLNYIMKQMGLGEGALVDAAYLAVLEDVERLQRISDNANARRDIVLREIDRRRDSFARPARQTIGALEGVIDAEFE